MRKDSVVNGGDTGSCGGVQERAVQNGKVKLASVATD